MSRIIKLTSGIYVDNRRRIDLTWIVKPMMYNTYKCGIIHVRQIMLPNKYVGKRFRIKLESVK